MKTFISFLLATILFTGIAQSAQAQIDIKGKIKEKTQQRVEQRTEEGIDKGLDKTEEGIKNSSKKKTKDPKENTVEEAEQPQDNAEGENTTSQTTQPKAQEKEQKLTSFTKYDFVAGDKVLLYEDFSQDAIGDFPALWTTSGSGEVRNTNLYPGNWLYMSTAEEVYCLMKNIELPENFILEFDAIFSGTEDNPDNASFYITLYNSDQDWLDDNLYPGAEGFHLTIGNDSWSALSYRNENNYSSNGDSRIGLIKLNKNNHVIIWAQKRRLRVYHDGIKVLDLPTLLPEGIKLNRFRVSQWSCNGLNYISNIRFTTAAPDTRSKLLTEGKLISYGIYFDVNSDVVKPESYGALNDIAKVLKENPEVKIKIVGHTDADGDNAKNLDLSKRRAANVKNALSKDFAIDAGRIQTDGKGETEPIAPNDNAENKSKNRRVEFLKL